MVKPVALERRRAGQGVFTSKLFIWAFHIAIPLALFWLLRADPILDPLQRVPQIHFYLVSLAATSGLVIAWTVAKAAREHRDSRVFFIALAFFGIAGIFLMHALSTESVLLSQGQTGFVWSPPLSLLLGGIFFFVSSRRLNDKANAWVLVNQNRLLVAFLAVLLGYVIIVVLVPDFVVGGLGLTAQSASGDYAVSAEGGAANITLIVMLLVAVAGYVSAALGYYRDYRRRHSVMLASLITGMVLFAVADGILAFSTAWHVSWWLYHVVMAIGFGMVGYGILVEYNKTRSVSALFEGIFLRQQIARINRSYTEVMIALINSLEAKDRYTKGHSARVAQYSVIIAKAMGYSEDDLRRLEQAALLHDIGKLAIPDAVLNKPGKLTPDEFDMIKNHPSRGCAIIASIDSLHDKVPGIRHHHEWFGGGGYPDGLAGEDIPLDARIIAVADVYDAMTSLRAYREPLSHEAAVDHLRNETPRHLDPKCVEIFVTRYEIERVVITDFTAQLPVHELVPRSGTAASSG